MVFLLDFEMLFQDANTMYGVSKRPPQWASHWRIGRGSSNRNMCGNPTGDWGGTSLTRYIRVKNVSLQPWRSASLLDIKNVKFLICPLKTHSHSWASAFPEDVTPPWNNELFSPFFLHSLLSSIEEIMIPHNRFTETTEFSPRHLRQPGCSLEGGCPLLLLDRVV